MSEGIPSQDGSTYVAPADTTDRKELLWPQSEVERTVIDIMTNTLSAGIIDRDPNGRPEELVITDGDVTNRMRINADRRITYLAQRGKAEAAWEEYDPQSGLYFDLLRIDRAGKLADGMFIQETIKPNMFMVQYYPQDGVYKIGLGEDLNAAGEPQTVQEVEARLDKDGYLTPIIGAFQLPAYQEIEATMQTRRDAMSAEMEVTMDRDRHQELLERVYEAHDEEKRQLEEFAAQPDTQAAVEGMRHQANELIRRVMPRFSQELTQLQMETAGARSQIEEMRTRFTQRT